MGARAEAKAMSKLKMPFAMGCRPPDVRSDECEAVSPKAETVQGSRTLALEAGWKMFDGAPCCPKCLALVHPGRRDDGMKGALH